MAVTTVEQKAESIRAAILVAGADGRYDEIIRLAKELAALEKANATALAEAQAEARLAYVDEVKNTLSKLRGIPQSVRVIGRYKFGEAAVFQVYMPSVVDIFHEAVDKLTPPSTVKAFSFELDNHIAKVELTGATSRSGPSNGTHGKGWAKDGTISSLGTVFNAYATEDEKGQLAGIMTMPDGGSKRGKERTLKVAVAKRNGYTFNVTPA